MSYADAIAFAALHRNAAPPDGATGHMRTGAKRAFACIGRNKNIHKRKLTRRRRQRKAAASAIAIVRL